MVVDLLKSEIKNDIRSAVSKHGLYIGDEYVINILRELIDDYR